MFRTLASSIKWRILSFPIFLKIIGIGITNGVIVRSRNTPSNPIHYLGNSLSIVGAKDDCDGPFDCRYD